MYWSNTIFLSPQTLLDDPHPTVRCNAILGVCKILAKCWELLPPTIITDFLKKLVMELAADSSSPDVRCSVFKVEDALSLFTFSWNNVQTVWSRFEFYWMKTENASDQGLKKVWVCGHGWEETGCLLTCVLRDVVPSVWLLSWTMPSAIQYWKNSSLLSDTVYMTTLRRSAQLSWTCSSRWRQCELPRYVRLLYTSTHDLLVTLSCVTVAAFEIGLSLLKQREIFNVHVGTKSDHWSTGINSFENVLLK